LSENGVVVGVVVNTTDPTGQRRVQVRLPTSVEGTGEWARVVTAPGGTRSGRVRFDLEDEVLIAFEHGDMSHPFVIGRLWKGDEPPHDASDQFDSCRHRNPCGQVGAMKPSEPTWALVRTARDALIQAIRAHAPRDEQMRLADEYISAIKSHARATGRRLPIPNRFHLLRALG
jgi:hypothetical protein